MKPEAKRIRKSIENDFFIVMEKWLAYNDTATAVSGLTGIAADAADTGLIAVRDLLTQLALHIEDGLSKEDISSLLSEENKQEDHGFCAPLSILKGRLQLRLNHYRPALESLENALQDKKLQCRWAALQPIGVALGMLGQFEEAANALKKAIDDKSNPDPALARLQLADVMQRKGDVQAAREAYAKAAGISDSFRRDYIRLRLEDIDAEGPLHRSDVLPVETGMVFEKGLAELADNLRKNRLVAAKHEDRLKEHMLELAGDCRLDSKNRLFSERFSPLLVTEIMRQYRDLEAGRHRGRLIEQQVCRNRQHLSVLKASIHGFTAHFKYLDLEDQIRFINDFLSRIAAVIFRYNGAIDRIQSTSVIASFGHVNGGSENEGARNSALDAIRTAFAMQDALIAFFKRVKKHFFELPVEKIRLEKGGYDLRERTLGLAVGISTGWCHFGQTAVGDRNGRLVVGHPVNMAHRMTEIARPREVLTSQTTFDLVEPVSGEEFRFEDVSAQIDIDGKMRLTSLKDYENRPIYRISSPARNGNGG